MAGPALVRDCYLVGVFYVFTLHVVNWLTEERQWTWVRIRGWVLTPIKCIAVIFFWLCHAKGSPGDLWSLLRVTCAVTTGLNADCNLLRAKHLVFKQRSHLISVLKISPIGEFKKWLLSVVAQWLSHIQLFWPHGGSTLGSSVLH